MQTIFIKEGFYEHYISAEDRTVPPVYIHIDQEVQIPEGDKLTRTEEPKGFFASKEESKRRLDICKTCPMKKLNICTACGCIIPMKVKLNIADCPQDKW